MRKLAKGLLFVLVVFFLSGCYYPQSGQGRGEYDRGGSQQEEHTEQVEQAVAPTVRPQQFQQQEFAAGAQNVVRVKTYELIIEGQEKIGYEIISERHKNGEKRIISQRRVGHCDATRQHTVNSHTIKFPDGTPLTINDWSYTVTGGRVRSGAVLGFSADFSSGSRSSN